MLHVNREIICYIDINGEQDATENWLSQPI
jgi:hypothetical protein